MQSLIAPGLAHRLDVFDADDAFAVAVCAFTDIPLDAIRGAAFYCVLPGHAEERLHGSPSASLFRDRRGRWVYRDWHGKDGCPPVLTLTDVYAARITGRVCKLRGPEAAAWKLRLLVELGIVTPVEVRLPPLPDDVPPYVRDAYDGLKLLFGAKWLYEPDAPTPLSWRFMEDWCGLPSPKRAGEAVQALFKARVIEAVGTYTAYGKSMALYLPVGHATQIGTADPGKRR